MQGAVAEGVMGAQQLFTLERWHWLQAEAEAEKGQATTFTLITERSCP